MRFNELEKPLSARVLQADARHMAELRDESVHLVVTSPPYWQIKDYGASAQIGYGQSLHDYLFDLSRVWAECFRALKPGRRLCVNIGDQFARASVYGRYRVIPLHSEAIAMGEACGFDFMGDIIWQKRTTMNTSGGAVIMGSFPHPPNGVVELDYEHILLFKKPGDCEKATPEQKAASTLSRDEWKLFFSGHWHFGGARQGKEMGHEATFPDELPRRLIRMFSFAGETVLDPFLGSGTTAKVALELGRDAIGYEVQPDFVPLIRAKLCGEQACFDAPEVCFEERHAEVAPGAPPAAYRPHVPDARPMRDADEERDRREREPLRRVAEVVDTTKLRMENGEVVSLIGVQVLDEKRQDALDYLRRYVRGKAVLLREDNDSDGSDPRQVYLLLSNKLFINRRMIEAGLARADRSRAHRHLARFVKAEEKATGSGT